MESSVKPAIAALTRRHFILWAGTLAAARFVPALGSESDAIAPQPYFAALNRALETLAKLGAPVAEGDAKQLAVLTRQGNHAAVETAEKIIDRYTLARVALGADGSGRTMAAGAQRTLIEQGWSVFLVRVSNPFGVMREFTTWGSAHFLSPSSGASRPDIPDTLNPAPEVSASWYRAELYEAPPLQATLSGAPVEYRVIQLYSRDRGQRRANISFFAPQTKTGNYEIVRASRATLQFDCLPSRDVLLRIHDADGRGCMASLTIKDKLDRVYPLQAMRLAPDMFFQPQIYRADRETVRLPDGEYTVASQRGPEYLRALQTVVVGEAQSRIEVRLQRWIDPAEWGWYSGDTHIHAAGCAHYEHPTEGVSPETIIRQVRGEGLAVGDILTWGPDWYYQKQFFTGHADSPPAGLEHPELQAANNASLQPQPTPEDSESLLRYDVEVSGFPSSHCGHLVLLRLKDQDFPGTKLIQDWPSWNLPILKWVKEQGAFGGYAHCGIGMQVDSNDLPNYEIPPMDGIGTQEGIMDVTHGVCDFLSGVDTNPIAELNAWYHMLNCGFRLAMIGETDWPCMTGDRVGGGRSYVRLDRRPVDDTGYEAWVRALIEGRLYCGDGRSHFLDFKVNGRHTGDGSLTLKNSEPVHVEAFVAARLEPEITPETTPPKPGLGWHLEWARIGKTRVVPVELTVNGIAVDRTTLLADGTPRRIRFKTSIARSSWVALRIMPSSHTHPVFVMVADKPIRASKRSAEWCRACVDKVWEVKSPFMRERERPAAARAFDHARATYDKIISDCEGA